MIDPALFAELKELCLRSFPERLGQRLSQIEIGKGRRYSTLTFALSWREGVRPRVERLLLRRYVDDWTWWLPHDLNKAHREWVVMRWLYGYGLPLPEVYALGALERDPFLLLARPAGQGIALGPNGRDGTSRTPSGQLPGKGEVPALWQHVDRLAKLLARLHRLSPPGSVREVLPHVDATEVLEQATNIAQQFEDRALMEAVHELDRDRVKAYPPCVLHGDPRFANCTCDARGITAWLNWENSALGDPRWDVACVANELHGVYPGELADQFCETYAIQTGLPLHDVAYWQALSAISRWAMTWQAQPAATAGKQSPLSARRQEFQEWARCALDRRARRRRTPKRVGNTKTIATELET